MGKVFFNVMPIVVYITSYLGNFLVSYSYYVFYWFH